MTPGEHDGRVVIAGAGPAGGKTCLALRAAGFAGAITLIGNEAHLPYDRPPLSKAVLVGGVDPYLDLEPELLGLDLQLGVQVTGVDLAARSIATSAGIEPYDALVLATGSEPVRLPGPGIQLTLRTLEDAHTLRASLTPGARIVIVGAGWIGGEVATAAIAAGCVVTCIEADQAPLAGPLGAEIGRRCLPWWSAVDLRLGETVASVEHDGVVLTGGEHIAGDIVVVGIGARARTEWLKDAGLLIESGGVAVDLDRRTSDPYVYAVGDMCARWSERFGERVRAGHWDEAVNGAAAVAAAVTGKPRGIDDVPYFWSDQFGHKLQYVGQHSRRDGVVIREHDHLGKWGAAWLDSSGRITAHLSVDLPRATVTARAAIAECQRVDVDRLRDLSEPI